MRTDVVVLIQNIPETRQFTKMTVKFRRTVVTPTCHHIRIYFSWRALFPSNLRARWYQQDPVPLNLSRAECPEIQECHYD